jgi:phospholipase C
MTYPNRRFLQAATAYGLIVTNTNTITAYPPNGTIWDRISDLGVTCNYYTEAPTSAIILQTLVRHPFGHLASIDAFYDDCQTGNLPAVSMVDSGMGLNSEVAKLTTNPTVEGLISDLQLSTFDEDEEFGDVSAGENFVGRVVDAVLLSPAWPRTLLVWCYDEHGGYYENVPPPAAIKPDSIAPALGPGDVSGAYDIYGPRVPAVVVSPYSRPGGVSNVVYDHTSILATIEAKWNLPALTYRDANAATLSDSS